jgi:hypothetical protein
MHVYFLRMNTPIHSTRNVRSTGDVSRTRRQLSSSLPLLFVQTRHCASPSAHACAQASEPPSHGGRFLKHIRNHRNQSDSSKPTTNHPATSQFVDLHQRGHGRYQDSDADGQGHPPRNGPQDFQDPQPAQRIRRAHVSLFTVAWVMMCCDRRLGFCLCGNGRSVLALSRI